MQKIEEKHICCKCGAEAHYQMKNGKWYCTQNYRKCPALGNKKRQKYINGQLKPYWKGKHLSQEAKKKKSQAMKKYIADNKIYWNKNKNKYKNGWYKGYQCDSSWQLAFVIYNLEHNIKFQRNKEGFEYQYQGQKHTYFPDFKLEDGTYVQIKGRMTQSAKIKINSFQLPLVIINQEGIKPYVDYAIQKYGRNFISLYQNVTYEDLRYDKCPICGMKKRKESSVCLTCLGLTRRKIQRPSKKMLKQELETNTYTALGKKYGVTDNTIKRWCKDYDIILSKEQMKIRKRENLLNNIKKSL